jgi:tyrosine aminotransferase
LKEALNEDSFSYDESAGIEKARQAVVEYAKNQGSITAKDVILASGCSMALEMCMLVLANRGENILIPRPAWNYTSETFETDK